MCHHPSTSKAIDRGTASPEPSFSRQLPSRPVPRAAKTEGHCLRQEGPYLEMEKLVDEVINRLYIIGCYN